MAGPPRIPLEIRYERHISRQAGGCWEWTGPVASSGYPQFRLGRTNKTISVHRWSYERHVGPIPPGKCVLHHCDNRKCSNPAHLYCGTHADNTRDMIERGRAPAPGKRSTGRPPKVTPEAVQRELADGLSVSAVAAKLKVSESTVYRLRP